MTSYHTYQTLNKHLAGMLECICLFIVVGAWAPDETEQTQ